MLNIKLPKTRYNTITYPNLEERADGAPIPIAYGDRHNVIPVCIDTDLFTHKVADHAIHSIDTVYNETTTLVLGSDYTVDLALAEFTLCSTPYLAANKLYYFVIEADYPISGSNYINFQRTTTPYVDGQLFTIDAGGIWTPDPTSDLYFIILGASQLTDQEIGEIDMTTYGKSPGIGLRNNVARTRLAQSFMTGPSPFYLTRIFLWTVNKGIFPTGKLRLTILSAYNPAEIRVGAQSIERDIKNDSSWEFYSIYFPIQSDISNLTCDIEGAEKTGATIIDGADMIEDLVVNRLGKASSILEPTALANFKTKRTQIIAAYIDSDTTFGDIVGKLESSLLFKLVPLHDGTYATTVYEAGEPAGTPHFFDEHFISFSMRRDFSAVKAIIKIKYDEDPGTTDVFKVSEADSDVAKLVYGVEDTLEVETYLKAAGDAATLAIDYLSMYETPPLEITFEIRGYGLNLIPGKDKVKITRTRAAYAGGILSGVLFRIVKITKKPATASTEIVAVLDMQTY